MQRRYGKIIFILLLTIFVTSCQRTDKKFYPYEFDTEKYQTVLQHKRVFLLPTQLSTPEKVKSNDLFTTLDTKINLYLEKNGYKVISAYEQALEIWNKNKKNNGNFYDQDTGQFIASRFEENILQTIADLNKRYKVSAIIIPKLIYHHIHLPKKSTQFGVWNGVKRTVESTGRHSNYWMRHTAMSLQVTVISDDNKKILKNRGGLDFVTKNAVKKRVTSQEYKKPTDILNEHIDEAIEIALYPFVDSVNMNLSVPKNYTKMVSRKVYKFMTYPEAAKNNKIDGKVIVRFKILSTGYIKNLEIVKSSGYVLLDNQVKKQVISAEPFPPPPAIAKYKTGILVELPIDFKR